MLPMPFGQKPSQDVSTVCGDSYFAGLNTPAYLVNGMSSIEAQARAADRDIETAALDMFALKRRDLRGLLLGFAAFDAREIKRGVLTLAEALRSTPGSVGEVNAS